MLLMLALLFQIASPTPGYIPPKPPPPPHITRMAPGMKIVPAKPTAMPTPFSTIPMKKP